MRNSLMVSNIVSTLLIGVTLTFASAFLVGGAIAHSVYASFTQIDWNAQDGSIELVIGLHSHELETKLSYIEGERLSFLEDEDFSKLNKAAGQYVLENIALTLDGQLIDLNYLGSETDGQNVTLYLEADWPKAPRTMQFMNAMFLQDLPGQTNSVLATVQKTRNGGDIVNGSGPLTFTF